jgi:hypothetical protein
VNYHTGSLNRARNRRILVQGSTGSDTVVIFGIRFEYPAQMRLAQDNDVGPHTRAGSIRSAVRQSHFARVKLVRWACPGCPWRAIGG